MPFTKLWEDGKSSTFRGSLCLLLLGISFPVRQTGNADLKEIPQKSLTLGARPQTAVGIAKTCQSQLGKRLAFVLECHLVPRASWCFTRAFLKLGASCSRGRGGVGTAAPGCWCGMLVCGEGAGMHPSHLVPPTEAGHGSLRSGGTFGQDAPSWDRACHRGCPGLGARLSLSLCPAPGPVSLRREPGSPSLSPWLAPAAACQASGTGEPGDKAPHCALPAPFPLPQSRHCAPFIAVKLQMNIKGREVHQNRGETKGFQSAARAHRGSQRRRSSRSVRAAQARLLPPIPRPHLLQEMLEHIPAMFPGLPGPEQPALAGREHALFIRASSKYKY